VAQHGSSAVVNHTPCEQVACALVRIGTQSPPSHTFASQVFEYARVAGREEGRRSVG